MIFGALDFVHLHCIHISIPLGLIRPLSTTLDTLKDIGVPLTHTNLTDLL